MFGSGRDRYTQLQHLGTHLQGLGKLCSKDHVHAPWGRDPATGVWGSASNSAYPPQLCRAWSECLSAELLHHGAQPRPRDLQGLDVHHVSAAAQAAAAQRQPRSKRLPPLVPEFRLVVTLVGPASTLDLPAKLPEAVSLPPQVKSSPSVALLPRGSRRLALTLPLGDVGQSEPDRAGLEAQSAPPFPMSAGLSDDQARALLKVLGEACSEDLSSRRPGVLKASGSGTKGSRYFVFGAYNHGSRSGLTAYTKGREKAVGVINSFAKALLPHATWTSIAVSHNELALPHRDSSNEVGSLNHSMTLGSFTAGRLFLAGGGGDDLLSDATGVEHRGFYVDNHARFATFDARSVLHATEEWQGDRWAVVLYTCKDPHFDKSHLDALCEMGFQPPSHWSSPVGAEPVYAASAVYGLPWSPKEFVEEAAAREHPLQACVVPLCVKEAIDKEARCSAHSLAQDRTAVLRRWTLRAQELWDSERQLHENMPAHISVVLQGKRLLLLKEMLQDAGYCDVGIVDQIASGFDLMGHIPEAGVFRSKTVPATLTPDEVRRTAKHTRQGILLGAAEGLRDEHALRLYEITLEERDKGWLQGPIDPSTLDDRASVSRRFAVFQSGKVRPIDDLSESLINSTTSRTEAVTPHGLDTICRSLTWRFQHRATVPVPNNPVLKSKDLRKAFKQLALSSEGVLDGYLCVGNPATGKVEVFSSSVLPFGGSASVTGFCRTSHALWYAGTVLLWLHWSVYFDDYLVTCEASVSKHCDLVLSSFFALLGWGISEEKEAEFATAAKVLGVVIDVGSSMLVRVSNTDERKAELTETITALLDKGTFSIKELTALRGRLVFAEGQIFGRGCYKHLKVVGSRIKSDRPGRIDPQMADSLRFIRDRVVNGPPRTVRAVLDDTVFLYTDACFEPGGYSGLGGVLVDSTACIKACYGVECTGDVLRLLGVDTAQNPIYVLEALALIAALQLFKNDIQGREVLAFLDNDGALGSFISCKSSCDCLEPLLDALVSCEEACVSSLWFERVSSEANISDAPSRGDFTELEGVHRVHCDLLSLVQGLLKSAR